MNVHLFEITDLDDDVTDTSTSISLVTIKSTLNFILRGYITAVSCGCDYFNAWVEAHHRITGIALLINHDQSAANLIELAHYELDSILRGFQELYSEYEQSNDPLSRSIALKVDNELNYTL